MGFTLIMSLIGFSAPLTAWVIGRFGARATMFIGGLITTASAALMGVFGGSYPLYLALSVVIGLGVAFASILPVQTVVISWFNTRRALALGLVLGGGGIGGFVAPQLINAAVQSMGGNWRIGWFIIALTSIVAMVVAILAVRNYPFDMGQHLDGSSPAEEKAATASVRQKSKTYRTTVRWTVRDAAKTPALWFLVVAITTSFFLWYVVLTQAPLHLRDRGFDPATAAFFYSLAIGLSIVGRFAIAALGDIIEPRLLFACGAICILIGGVLFWFVSLDAIWVAYLYSLLAGFGFGAAYVCIPTMVGNYWGPEAFAGVSGIVSSIAMAFEAAAGPLAGFLHDLQGTYFTVLLISWIATVFGIAAIFLCHPPSPKWA